MKRAIAFKTLVLIVLFSIVIFGFKVTDQQNRIQKYELERLEISDLLTGSDAPYGYSCGVLSTHLAKELLGGESKLYKVFGLGPTNTVQPDKTRQKNIFWSDNCRYEDSANSARYVEMYVATFKNKEASSTAFPDFIQIVNDAKEISSQNFGQRLVYDSGVFYLLKDNKVIQVSASNGSPKEIESFSRIVFENLISKL